VEIRSGNKADTFPDTNFTAKSVNVKSIPQSPQHFFMRRFKRGFADTLYLYSSNKTTDTIELD
jgi:hypothetical protein